MRRAAAIGTIAMVVCLLFAWSGPSAQRIVRSDGNANASSQVPVAVTNFPRTQAVTGSVDVRNFPQTVNVQGTVDVGNLPLDEKGNVRVSPGGPSLGHFVGITQALVAPVIPPGFFDPDVYPILASNVACQAEFSGTRACLWGEVSRSIPTPPQWDGCVIVATDFDRNSDGGLCVTYTGDIDFNNFPPAPVICCGF